MMETKKKMELARLALKNLSTIIEQLEKTQRLLEYLRVQAMKRQLTNQGVNTVKAISALGELISELEGKRISALKTLKAINVPVKNLDKPKLKLVVNNEKGENK